MSEAAREAEVEAEAEPRTSSAAQGEAASGGSVGADAAPAGSAADGRRTAARTGAVGAAVAVAFAHATNDTYVAFLHPLLPRIMDRLGLSIALAATLTMALSISASIAQPLMGYLADRYGRRLFVVLGPLASGVFLSLIGLAPSFGVLLALLMLGGLGSSAFHPPAASLVGRAAEGKGSGMRMSLFSFGGNAGYAAGPLIAVTLVAAVGMNGLAIAMVPAIAVAAVLARVLPADSAGRAAAPPPAPGRLLRLLRGPLGIVFGISAAGAFIQRVFLTMEPIVVASAGGSEATGALMLSVYLAGQALGSLTGGFLADRLDRRRLLAGLTLLALPAHMLAMWLRPGSAPALAFACLAGLANMAVLPPIVVIAQEIVPAGAAVSSGIVMGLAWATGSVGVLGAGVLGDAVGAQTAALAVTPAILIGTALAFHPALRAHRRPPAPDAG